MLRTTIIPDKTNFPIPIPQSYLGKKLEVIIFSVDESKYDEPKGKKPSAFFGSITEEEGEKFLEYVNQSRQEWNRNI
jgi:hypothetical protein